ncbi:hypothetical protein HZC21_00625 [Candidatus Peregrinibacteria bacterium]|nr:hypothetical protein [Candidatus Peregrinibacteria bacterium]
MNKKWLIGIVVVVALGALVYFGTNTDLFKGALRGEKGGWPVVPKAKCEMFKKYNEQNGYTALMNNILKGKQEYWISCQITYSELFWIANKEECENLKKLQSEGNLTSGALAKLDVCLKSFPNL